MRMKIHGFRFQRTPLIQFLKRAREMEFEVSPAYINNWADAIYASSEYGLGDTEETQTETQQAA